jgi:hypothetical protein
MNFYVSKCDRLTGLKSAPCSLKHYIAKTAHLRVSTSLPLLMPLLLYSWLLSHPIFIPPSFTHGLIFHPEEESSIFLENSGEYQADYTTPYSSRRYCLVTDARTGKLEEILKSSPGFYSWVYLVSRGLSLDAWAGPYEDEGVQEM